MTKRTSPRLASFRYFLVYLLTLGVATTLLVDPSQLWAWTLAAVLGVGFGIHVHRISQRWLEAMNADLEELGDRPIPEEVEEGTGRLLEAGFDGPQWWVDRDQIGATLLSPNGSISAVVAAGDEHTGPILRTKWEGAELQTSRGLAIPFLPNGYVQNLADVDLPALLTAHDEAAEALSRVYGEPIQRDELTLGSLNDARRRRRDVFQMRRYRQTAKFLAIWYQGGYHDRVVKQLGLTTPAWDAWILTLVGWFIPVGIWVYFLADGSSEDLPIVFSATILFGAVATAATLSLRRRRRFSQGAGR